MSVDEPYTFAEEQPINVPPSSAGTLFRDVPDDIVPPYVVAGMGGYYVSTPHQTLKIIIAIILGLVLIMVLLMIAFGIYWSGFNTTIIIEAPDPIKYPPNPIANLGVFQGKGVNQSVSYTGLQDGVNLNSETSCTAAGTGLWQAYSSTCSCLMPYWGDTCGRESYKPQYVGAGRVTAETVTFDVITTTTTANLS